MKTSLLSCMVALLPLTSFNLFADQALLEKARTLHASGQPAQAYQLLLNQADKNAGDPEFDYLLGTTAIDAGEPLQAVFALERVLDAYPDNAPARAELARAYFLIGENQAAQKEFNKARQSEMPEAARAQIDSYLSSIDERILGGKQRTVFYAEAGMGFDSNVNSATDSSQITAPGGVYVVGAPEKDSATARAEVGGSFSRALKTNLNLYGNGKLEFYQPDDASQYATRNTDAAIGLHFMHGREQYRVSLVAQNYAVERSTSRNLWGLNGQWQHASDANNQFSMFAQYASLQYLKSEILDADQFALGASWIHSMSGAYQPVVYLTGYLGVEEEKDDSSPSSGRDYFGVRAGVSLRGSARLSWNGVIAYQSSEYHGPDATLVTRDDNYINIELAASYAMTRQWLLKPEISYTKNDSNSGFSEYSRGRAMINVRKEF